MINKKFLLIILILQLSIIYSNDIYILQEGDTLYSLSKRFDINIEELIKLNSIDDINSLSVGSELIIGIDDIQDSSNIELETYVVSRGDTLFNISQKFNLPLSIIMQYNNLTADSIISLGQVLKLQKIEQDIVVNEENDPNNQEKNIVVETEKYTIDESVPYWPVNGNISKYSGRIQGVKIEGNSGEYIKAVSAGKVIWYDSFKGIGKVVLIEGDNGYDYLYGTKENLDVRMGVQITAGDRLGRLKESNTSIIFSVFKNGTPLTDISEAPR